MTGAHHSLRHSLSPVCPSPRPCSVRMQKLEAFKEARAGGAKRQVEEVDAEAAAAARAIADPEVERPVIQLAKKRRVSCCSRRLSCCASSEQQFTDQAVAGLAVERLLLRVL